MSWLPCNHPWWVTLSRTYRPPRGTLQHVRNVDEDLLLSMQYGLTTVAQRCDRCGKERAFTVPGEVGDVTPEGRLCS